MYKKFLLIAVALIPLLVLSQSIKVDMLTSIGDIGIHLGDDITTYRDVLTYYKSYENEGVFYKLYHTEPIYTDNQETYAYVASNPYNQVTGITVLSKDKYPINIRKAINKFNQYKKVFNSSLDKYGCNKNEKMHLVEYVGERKQVSLWYDFTDSKMTLYKHLSFK